MDEAPPTPNSPLELCALVGTESARLFIDVRRDAAFAGAETTDRG